jgi:dihydrofolate synthase/folylpolyglutamate synthase
VPAAFSADDPLSLEPLSWLYGRIDYERAITMPYRHDDFRLDRMRTLLEKLGSPDLRYAIVHIAGTKGKGSTAAMVTGILSEAGLGTGLFTSPHLERIEERIRWNGQPIEAAEFVSLIQQVRPAVLEMDVICQRDGYGGPTFFEITTAMALCCFAARGAAVVVLEVGLGGRLDSTNVVTPAVSAITSISFDHTKQLGRTLAAIAGEKCGIIKPGVPVVSGVTDFEAGNVVRHVAEERGCALQELSRDFEVAYESPDAGTLGQIVYRSKHAAGESSAVRKYQLGLIGRHQAANAALAITIADELRGQGFAIPDDAYAQGLSQIKWPARIEVLQHSPTVVLDAAHNVASIAALLETLRECFPARKRWLIFATSRDKPAEQMLRQLRTAFDEIVLTRYQHNPRAVPIELLAEMLATADNGSPWHRRSRTLGFQPKLQGLAARGTGPHIHQIATPEEAWNFVRARAAPEDLICITGSFFLAAEIRPLLVGPAVPGKQ